MHSVFLYHAIAAGMGYGNLNAAACGLRRIEPELREAARCRPQPAAGAHGGERFWRRARENYKGQGCGPPRRISPGAKSLSQSVWNMRSSMDYEFIDRDVEKHGPPLPARSTSSKAADGRHECRGRSLRSGKMFCRSRNRHG